VIVGGESGPRLRPLQPGWVRGIRDQCAQRGAAFFFKQWGGFFPKARGRTLNGREWNEMPSARAPHTSLGLQETAEALQAGGD
jgi:protein gp37